MKKLLILASIIFCLLAQEQSQQSDSTEQYRAQKAHEAIIYDTYDEVMFLEDIPQAYKDAILEFALDPNDIHFYTAVRMHRFVKKVGNNIVLLWPNFFLYLTEQEQVSEIGVQLARIKAGDNRELDGKHNPSKKRLQNFRKITVAITALLLAGIYRNELIAVGHAAWPYVKEGICSKAAKLIAACIGTNTVAKSLYAQEKLKKFSQYEFDSVDTLGAEGLIGVRERQVVWGKLNSSWPAYQWYKLLGRLYLTMMPEVELERINEHLVHAVDGNMRWKI